MIFLLNSNLIGKNCMDIHIVGAGLAGSSLAYFLAEQKIAITLYEMRPQHMTEAHLTGDAAELVCSNSFKSLSPDSATGLLKQELKSLNSLILKAADYAQIPAGSALAVDRLKFSQYIEQAITQHPYVHYIKNHEIHGPFKHGITVIATGPLTSPKLTQWLQSVTDKDLYFYDAIAPIISANSINMEEAFFANRYDHGEEVSYLNCPLTQAEYESFVDDLKSAKTVPSKYFEQEIYYQGCMPIEAIAEQSQNALRYGPMKPVGLKSKHGRPYAVIQLRPENSGKTAYNMVGFQTKMTYGEQTRVLKKIPALANANFLRHGSIHRNTFICSPKLLRGDLSLSHNPNIFFAGQITGVEGYLESTASGILTGIAILSRLKQKPFIPPPPQSAMGALYGHLKQSDENRFQPSGIHFGLWNALHFEKPKPEWPKESKNNFNLWFTECGRKAPGFRHGDIRPRPSARINS